MEQLHQTGEGEQARLYQIGIQQGEGGLQPHDAHGALLQPTGLLLGAVGGVIGAVGQPLQQGLPVGGTAERGIHLEAAVLLQHGFVHQQIVGGRLTGDVQPLRLGPADQGHALLGGDVADVVAAAGLAHQL